MSKAPVSVGKNRFRWQDDKSSDYGHVDIVDGTIIYTDLDKNQTVIKSTDAKYIMPNASSIIVALNSGKQFRFNYLSHEPSPLYFLSDVGMLSLAVRQLEFIKKSKLKEHTEQLLNSGFKLKKTKFMSFDIEFLTDGFLSSAIGSSGWIFSLLVFFLVPIAIYGNLAGLNSDASPRSMPELYVEIGLFVFITAHYWFYLVSGYNPKSRVVRLYTPFVLFIATLILIATQ